LRTVQPAAWSASHWIVASTVKASAIATVLEQDRFSPSVNKSLTFA